MGPSFSNVDLKLGVTRQTLLLTVVTASWFKQLVVLDVYFENMQFVEFQGNELSISLAAKNRYFQ